MMKRLPILLIAITSALPVLAAPNRTLVYIGLSSQTNIEIDRIKKINGIFQSDIHERLAKKINLTDISEAYIYSQTADIKSIADTGRARWVLYGKAENDNTQSDGRLDITMKLYDSVIRKDVETVSFRAYERETARFKNNIEYIYSKIAETNGYFQPVTSNKTGARKGRKNASQKQALSPQRVVLLKFMTEPDLPSDFEEMNEAVRKYIFERKQSSPVRVPEDKLEFMNMRTREYEAAKRLTTIGEITDARWIVLGKISKGTQADVNCTVKLFDLKTNTSDSFTVKAPTLSSMEEKAKRRLESFVLKISAENGYAFHREGGFQASAVKLPADTGALSGTLLEGSGMLLACEGKIIGINEDGAASEILHSHGRGLKKFSLSGGIHTDQFGRMYVMDTVEGKIIVFHKDGSFISEFFYGPKAVNRFIVTSGGYVFIPDQQNALVQIYTKDGSHIRDVYADTPANEPFELCLFKGNPVIIAKIDGSYRQTFLSQNGSLLRRKELNIPDGILHINAAAMDSSENMYCIDSANSLLFCLSKEGNIMWIKKQLSGMSPALFVYPSSVSSDFLGHCLSIIDSNRQRILLLKRLEQTDTK